jgi:hypothetical protein
MTEIIYNPEDVGKEVVGIKGRVTKIRKFHMTPEESELAKHKWHIEVSTVDSGTRRKVHKHFFNPYRQGIYYYQLQALFLLGGNKWHSLGKIVGKLEEYTSKIGLRKSVVKKHGYHTAWDKFRGKTSRENARTCKDYLGRIQENFILLQRLSMLNPYGYKLNQVCGALDIKRVSRPGFSQGVYSYRLSTYDTSKQALPIKDFTRFIFPSHESKYVSYKFIGTIITKDRTIVEGVVI